MARGLRSSRLKANNTKLRTKVFGPVEEARLQRLSSKQASAITREISRTPAADRPARELDFGDDVNAAVNAAQQEEASKVAGEEEEMDVDEGEGNADKAAGSGKARDFRKEKRKAKRDSKRKPRNLIAFKVKAKKPMAERRRPPRI